VGRRRHAIPTDRREPRPEIEPLRIEFDVVCPPERAFELWTTKTSMWWPTSHTVSARPDIEIVIELAVGGRIYERTPEGEEHDWGKVTAWEQLGARGADQRHLNERGWARLLPYFKAATG